MATIRKFKAIRPAKEYVEKVAALPYDVMSSSEARVMVEGNPYSFLHIDRSEIDLPEGTNPYSEEVYKKASDTLYKMIEERILVRDSKAHLYIYELKMGDSKQTGIVACTSIDEYLDETIKKHELTRQDKEEDRINHVDYCDANTGPIFLAYGAKDSIRGIVSAWKQDNDAEYSFISEDGIGHSVWVIDDEDVADELIELFMQVDNLYIADGHHRNASAVKVGLKRRESNLGYTGEEEFNYYLSVVFPDDELRIFDYNRFVYDLNGNTIEGFLDKISEKFSVRESEDNIQYSPKCAKEFGMYLDGRWYCLESKVSSDDPVKNLDVSILQDELLYPILGINDPRVDKRIEFIGGIRGLSELEKRVCEKKGSVAFSMYPTTMRELMAIADQGKIMPPKSTWFEPKLRSGLFIHELK